MTLLEQIQTYWTVCQCWHNYDLAVKQKMSFGRVVQLLRGIIEDPRSSCIRVLAQKLLDDISQNSDAGSAKIPTAK